MHGNLWSPFPPIEAGKESLDVHRAQGPAEWLEPHRIPTHGLRHQPEAVPKEELAWDADAPASKSPPDGSP